MYKDTLYKSAYFKRLEQIKNKNSDIYQTFFVHPEGPDSDVLSPKLKELIIIAVAHTTGCPYYVKLHVNHAENKVVSKEEAVKVIKLTAALKAGADIAHGVVSLNVFSKVDQGRVYRSVYFHKLQAFSSLSKAASKAFTEFSHRHEQPSLLEAKEKALIAVAVACASGCTHCMDLHLKNAKNSGATNKEIAGACHFPNFVEK